MMAYSDLANPEASKHLAIDSDHQTSCQQKDGTIQLHLMTFRLNTHFWTIRIGLFIAYGLHPIANHSNFED